MALIDSTTICNQRHQGHGVGGAAATRSFDDREHLDGFRVVAANTIARRSKRACPHQAPTRRALTKGLAPAPIREIGRMRRSNTARLAESFSAD